MTWSSDQLFRRVWFINGILLLVLSVGLLVAAGYGILSDLWRGDAGGVQTTAKGTPPPSDARPRALRYGAPEGIVNTGWTLVQVRYGKDYGEPKSGAFGSNAYESRGYNGSEGPLVNVAFLPPGGGPGRLLLDRPAYIRYLEFPERTRSSEPVDSVPWITYAIALDDTDQNGRMDSDDRAELYISDLDGANFRRVLPAGLELRSTEILPDRRLFVTVLDRGKDDSKPEDQLPQQAFRYNPRTGELTSDGVLDSLVASASRILGRP